MREATKDKMGRWPVDLGPYMAMRAVLRTMQDTGKPTRYLTDLAVDAALLYQYQPERFVIGIGECGTHTFLFRGAHNAVRSTLKAYGSSLDWYIYDEDQVSPGPCFHNEPYLRPVT